MSQHTPQDHISRKKVLYSMPGVDAVTVRRDVEYRATDAGPLTMDLYYPPDSTGGARTPAVVFVTGFSDAGAQKMFGCVLKEMGSYVSWAQLAAASGMVAVTYTNHDPAADAHTAIEHVRQNAESLGIDENRIGVFSFSGNVPTALSVLMRDAGTHPKCAVLCYPYTLDLDGATHVANAARQFGFVTPCAGRTIDDLPRDVSLFIARAGQDRMPGLNEALDRFVNHALTRNLPLTVVNHPTGPHAFDLFDDSETTREIIRHVLAFLRFNLAREERTGREGREESFFSE